MDAISTIALERQKQLKKGFTPESDNKKNDYGQLIGASMIILQEYFKEIPIRKETFESGKGKDLVVKFDDGNEEEVWPGLPVHLKEGSQMDKLRIAASLIVAEMERIQIKNLQEHFEQPEGVIEVENKVFRYKALRYNGDLKPAKDFLKIRDARYDQVTREMIIDNDDKLAVISVGDYIIYDELRASYSIVNPGVFANSFNVFMNG